jgi:hypothetical protein
MPRAKNPGWGDLGADLDVDVDSDMDSDMELDEDFQDDDDDDDDSVPLPFLLYPFCHVCGSGYNGTVYVLLLFLL